MKERIEQLEKPIVAPVKLDETRGTTSASPPPKPQSVTPPQRPSR